MQCAKHQMAGLGCRQRQSDSLKIAQLTHQDDIRIFTQCRAQRFAKAVSVAVHFALINQTLFALVDKFNRVFDG